jgi:alanyl aminopeptidase
VLCAAPPQAQARQQSEPGRLPAGVRPLSYDLELTIDPRKPEFSGVASIEVELAEATREIHFHGQDMRFESAAIQYGLGFQSGTVTQPDSGVESDSGERVLQLDTAVGPGTALLSLHYRGPFNKQLAGLYRAEQAGRWYAYTQFEAADARKAFPCFDEPGFKVPFRVVLTVPREMKAFSNTPAIGEKRRGKWKTVRFAESEPMPTYLVAFVVGDVDVVAGPKSSTTSSVPLRALVPKGKGALATGSLDMASSMLPILEDYFGLPYPYRKLDLAALTEFSSGAMENAGLVTFREERLLYDPATVPARVYRRIARTMAHELGHMWFGDLVTMKWWDDLWLNEAFATWVASKVVDRWRPELRDRDEMLKGRADATYADMLAAARAVRQPVRTGADAEGAFDTITYVKGANVLAMIERWVGEATFRQGVQAYLKTHAWKNATAQDLFTALDRASGKDVSAVARSFLDRAGVPLITVDLECPPGQSQRQQAQLSIRQERYRPLGSAAPEGFPGGGPWRVPVCVLYPAGATQKEQCFLLAEAQHTVKLTHAQGCPAWVYPNAGDSGYYRWAVPEQALRALATEARPHLSELGRMALLEEAWGMVAAGRLGPAGYLELLDLLRNAPDGAVVEQLVAGIERLAHTWAPPGDHFQRFAGRILGPARQRLGWDAPPNEDEASRRLRPMVLQTFGRHARPERDLGQAAELAQRYLAKPKSVNADVAPVALALAAREGHLSFEVLHQLLTSTTEPQERLNALGALAWLPPGKPLGQALALLLTPTVRAQDLNTLLDPALGRDEARAQVLAFVEEHFSALTARMPSFGWRSVSRLPQIVQSFCTEADRRGASAFFEAKKIAGGERFLSQGSELAGQCIALRAHGQAAVAEYLRRSE